MAPQPLVRQGQSGLQCLLSLLAERSSFSLISSFTFFLVLARSFVIPEVPADLSLAHHQLSSAHQRSAVQCRALPCPAVPCRAVRHCAMLCGAVRWCAVLCRAVPYLAVLCRVVPCCAVLCRAVPCCAVLRRAECFAVLSISCMYSCSIMPGPS